MPECVCCRPYLVLDTLDIFGISLRPSVPRDIKFSDASRSKYSQQETHAGILFYVHVYRSRPSREMLSSSCIAEINYKHQETLSFHNITASFKDSKTVHPLPNYTLL